MEGHLTETEKKLMEEGNLAKTMQKLYQGTRLWSNYSHSVNLLQVKETDINVNSSVKAQDANVTQKT